MLDKKVYLYFIRTYVKTTTHLFIIYLLIKIRIREQNIDYYNKPILFRLSPGIAAESPSEAEPALSPSLTAAPEASSVVEAPEG